jgi:hypothetical protein
MALKDLTLQLHFKNKMVKCFALVVDKHVKVDTVMEFA